ncbi:MAG: hypothetical protein HW378_2377 [Anaerolineales bacterium]|nr:hypothetical protein [Anaerolineales bacterium]
MFTLGKLLDPHAHTLTNDPLLYDPADLTTHAVCVGMTGSGKTGLCIDLLEEAALSGLPAILIDPKGDIANLLLQFPDLKPEDFQPWVNVDDARRAKLTVEEFAKQKADEWKAGLAQWGLGPENIQKLKDAVEWAVYTPGSDAGRPVSILKSLEAPEIAWDENQEILRERIAGICAALLGLVGLEADPVKSREHILLANIFENAWKSGQPLDLAGLITQVQTPPFPKLGVFEVDRFYPEKDRMELALALNAIVAAPSFQSWISGEPLDIPALLRTPEGKPRISIMYVAHLTETERMFFITLLLEQIGAWLRGQSGTTSLRALLYFDEVYGYFPPHPYNPPSKVPLLRLLKQARAFGLGVVLVTQNPGDLDYKGLTNAGTWFIGKLQTERDKARLLEGLETISAQSRAVLDIATLDTLISSLAPRTFLLHNVHAPAPVVFQTRWAMSYLAGPLTREQIRILSPKPDAGSAKSAAAPLPPRAPAPRPISNYQSPITSSAVSSSIPQYFLPSARTLEDSVAAWREETGNKRAQFGENVELVYHPALLAQAVVRFILPKANVNEDRRFTFLVAVPGADVAPPWRESAAPSVSPATLSQTAPVEQVGNLPHDLPPGLTDPKKLAAWQKDLLSYLYRTADLTLRHNPTLKLYSRPGQSYEEFRAACQQAANVRRDEEVEKVRARYDKKLDALEDKLAAEQREMKDDQEQLRAREDESRWTGIENILGLALGHSPRRMFSTSASKERLKQRAKAEVAESAQTVTTLQSQISALKDEAQATFKSIIDKWNAAAQDVHDLRVTPKRSDILVELFGLGWLPHWQIEADGKKVEIPAFEA